MTEPWFLCTKQVDTVVIWVLSLFDVNDVNDDDDVECSFEKTDKCIFFDTVGSAGSVDCAMTSQNECK